MFIRSRRCTAFGTFALLITLLVSIAPRLALASHENIVVDGDLTDLINAINNNLGPDKGGFSSPDPLGDTYTLNCAYVNGYDIRQAYVLIDFKDAMGHVTPNDITFYAGWQQEGTVGDVDGDGNADTFDLGGPGGSTGCAISDEPGIGPNESYNVILNLDCTGAPDDVRIQIKNNTVSRVVGGVITPLPTATFSRSGNKLELKVPHYEALLQGLQVTTDLCDAQIRLTANAEFDGPGEDIAPTMQLALLPSVDVTKTPPTQSICAGSPVSWTITVTNDGLCVLTDVAVNDVLGAGLDFDSSTPPPSSQLGQDVNWTYTGINLGPGAQIQITLHATSEKPCASPTLTNDVSVEAVHLSGCNPVGQPPPTATDNASATVSCRDLPPCNITGDTATCVGASKTFSTTVTSPFTRHWVVSSVPPGICNTASPLDGASITVNFTGEGVCTVQLIVTDPLNSEACTEHCEHEITVHPQPPCGIGSCPPATGPPLTTSCVGDTLKFCTSAYPDYSVAWSLIGTPGACQFIGPTNTGMVQVKLIAAGTCTLKLVVYDPADSADCNTMCTQEITAHPTPPCDISGATSASVGDTVTITTGVDPNVYQLMWMGSSNPPGICHFDGPTNGSSVDVIIDGTGTCTITLRVKDPANPNECFHDCSLDIEVAPEGFACPHTIGFWRQQCAQKGNGSTKVCRLGVEALWRCVINATDVIQWKKNDGSYETTTSLRALTDPALFDHLCSQLQGPRPMTIRDMTEIQYLGLMLNVCSGALPLDTQISNSFQGTVQEAIDAIENALNTGQNLDHWKTVADDINNRLGVLAADCPDGDNLFRNLPPCHGPTAPGEIQGSLGFGNTQTLSTRPSPNPVTQNSTSIVFNVPSRLGSGDVTITFFDVTGRIVRTLNPGTGGAGQYSEEWNLRDDNGDQVPSGIYFYRLTIGEESVTEKLMVVRK